MLSNITDSKKLPITAEILIELIISDASSAYIMRTAFSESNCEVVEKFDSLRKWAKSSALRAGWFEGKIFLLYTDEALVLARQIARLCDEMLARMERELEELDVGYSEHVE